MKVLTMPRRGGKTTAMLAWMRDNPESVCLCISEQEAERLRQENVVEFGSARFISVDSARAGLLRGRHPLQVGLDNADLVLSRFLGIDVNFATVNDDDTES